MFSVFSNENLRSGGESDSIFIEKASGSSTRKKKSAATAPSMDGYASSVSPVLQDGRLIGAVTHVLVDDPTCGYAISIERMLEEMTN